MINLVPNTSLKFPSFEAVQLWRKKFPLDIFMLIWIAIWGTYQGSNSLAYKITWICNMKTWKLCITHLFCNIFILGTILVVFYCFICCILKVILDYLKHFNSEYLKLLIPYTSRSHSPTQTRNYIQYIKKPSLTT